AWNLYWRGEVFWSGDEIWGPLPDLRADWQLEKNVGEGLKKMLADPASAPAGRRYFVISQATAIMGLPGTLPARRADGTPSPARESFTVVDTTSNKFTLAYFDL